MALISKNKLLHVLTGLVMALTSLLFFPLNGVRASEFPLRQTYPSVMPISTTELENQYGQIIIADVRSRFEFDIIHIKKAVHLPVAKITFHSALDEITGNNKARMIAFYCNGTTCAKSYKAAQRAVEFGYVNAFAYDSGIFDWVKRHPERSVLLGESPVPLSKLISDAEFEKHLLNTAEFKKRCHKDTAILIDVRDPIQRKKTPDFGIPSLGFDMNRFVENLDNPYFTKRFEGKTVLFFDAVGKQVQWLQYYLERHGIGDYFFLKQGAWSIFGAEGANP